MSRRHDSLIPLSQDHYHGLLLAQQIKTADRVMMSGWPPDDPGRARFVRSFYAEHLIRHFEEEEQVLFPLAVDHIPESKSHVEDLLDDHRRMEDFVRAFEQQDAVDLATRLMEFGDLLERHIRKEERVFFPLFEQKAPAEILARVGHLLHRSTSGGTPPTS